MRPVRRGPCTPPLSFGCRGHPSASLGALQASFSACFELRVIAHPLAFPTTHCTHLSAERAEAYIKPGAPEHEARILLANIRAVQQLHTYGLRYFAVALQGIDKGFQTDIVALNAGLNAPMRFLIQLFSEGMVEGSPI